MRAMAAAYSHPRLGLQSYGDNTDDDGSSSSGELRRGLLPRPAAADGPRRRRSYGDVALAAGAGGVPSIKPRRRSTVASGGDDEDQVSDETAMAPISYVSFEDLLGTETFTFWNDGGGGGGQQPPERGISDPLVGRTASRPFGREVATVKPPRKRGRSPGALGTRRGSAMHGLVKKYVTPFFGFMAGIFCCRIPS